MRGVIVVVAYRPKPSKEREVIELVRSRVPTLRKEGLVTDLVPIIMRARDGTIIEVSEWKSREGDRCRAQKSKRPRDVEQIVRDLRLCSAENFGRS
jgi:hypothetical protein